MVDINEYTRETTCEYKGEVYSVRDNGAVMRHAREGKKFSFFSAKAIKSRSVLSAKQMHFFCP